ncbi:MAG: hypothetical protein EKK64_01120 [Neisseriaceae bacterium]|nr:MAG: hypothetical protein EKK64_01120 [Neisseriaceae bacterium]
MFICNSNFTFGVEIQIMNMKQFKKLAISTLVFGLISVGMISCGSGGASNNEPTVIEQEIKLPAGFDYTRGDDGVAINKNYSQIAVPINGSYQTLQLTESQITQLNNIITSAGGIDKTAFTLSNNTLVVAPIKAESGDTVMVLAQDKNAQSKNELSSQDKSLTGFYSAISWNVKLIESPSTPFYVVSYFDFFGAFTDPIVSLMYGYHNDSDNSNGIVYSKQIWGWGGRGQEDHLIPVTQCTGEPSYVSRSNDIKLSHPEYKFYMGYGTKASKNNVCVVSVVWADSLEKNYTYVEGITNLAGEAPTGDKANAYNGGAISQLSFPSNLNTMSGNGNLVGYWTAANTMYKIFGSFNNGNPVGSGFLNIMSQAPQKQNGQSNTVKFYNTPQPNKIHSTYVDNSGNIWIGTNNAMIYYLVNGKTSWNSIYAIANVPNAQVNMFTNLTDSGATAMVFNPATKTFTTVSLTVKK